MAHQRCIQQSCFDAETEFVGNQTCVDGTLSLYVNSPQSDGNVTSITGIPLACIGGRYTALCDDNTTDFRSASVLCNGLGYYSELEYMNSFTLDFY